MIIKTKSIWWVGLILVVIVFIIVKSQDLNIPYFWDELGVYAPGALKMKDSGHIGILPGNLDPEYSRGHPLLCFFIHALSFRLFGDTVFVAHATSLFTGCCMLIAGYFFTRSVFNEKAALLYAFLMPFQPFFYAMSGIILPENLLALFAILSLRAIVTRKWWQYILFASCALLTKESGIVIPVTALLYLLILSIKERSFFTKDRLAAFFAAGMPMLVFIGFLVIQKVQHGWYFFPQHVGLMDFSLANIDGKLNRMFSLLFLEQGRWLISIPGILYLAGEIIEPAQRREQRHGILLLICFLFLSACFTSINFYLDRYTLFVLPFVVMLGAQAWIKLITLLEKKALKVAVVVGFCGCAAFAGIAHMDSRRFHDCVDMAYKHTVFCVADAVQWSERQPWAYQLIDATFPVFQALDDKRNGYLKGKPWPHSANIEKEQAKYGIYFYLNEDRSYIGQPHRVLKRFDRHYAHIEIVEYK